MKSAKVILTIVLLGFDTPAYPITQIGGGKVADSKIGFEAPLKSPFQFSAPDQSNGLTLYSQSMGRGPVPPVGFLPTMLRPLDVLYPELAGKTRDEVSRFFLNIPKLKFHHYLHPVDSCIDIYSAQTRSETVVVAAWGAQPGVVFVTSTDFDLREAILDMVDGITLSSGACQWP